MQMRDYVIAKKREEKRITARIEHGNLEMEPTEMVLTCIRNS